jgi:cytochrome o ubiquinol oxidase subunit IV
MEKETDLQLIAREEPRGTFKSYVIGFISSILLTLLSYFFVVENILEGWTLILTIVGFGLIQVIVQLVFFLHLGTDPKHYWNLYLFLFMVLVLVIVVIGTLWIMYNLDYRIMKV